MKKTTALISIVAVCGVVLFATNANRTTPRINDSQNPGAAKEMQIKQSMLEKDVQLTDELCRTQCTLDFRAALHQLKTDLPARVKSDLSSLKQEHEHIQYVEWIQGANKQGALISEGTIPASVKHEAETYIQEARQQVQQGKTYQSKAIGAGDEHYFVLGVPAADQKASLVGLVHQDLLRKVEVDLRKNLRLVPYPSDKRYKIESVDSNTLKDVKVDHPEDNEGTSHYHVNEVVVKFQNDPSPAELARIQSEIGSESMQKIGYTYVFRSSGMEAKQLMAYFQKWNVAYVEPHFLYMTNETTPVDAEPNDVLYKKYQWNLPAIGTLPAWDINKGNTDVIVAVVDTGVDLTHSDLKDQLLPGFNVVSQGKDPQDDVGHGTHVAGVISALVNNHEGVAGMTWFNKILPVKVLDETGAGSTYSVAQGIIWATDHGAKVINMSLGNYAQANFLHDAVKYAYDRDVVLIAASGNDNSERPGYPAAYPEVFAVAATDSSKQKAPFSNFGDYIDVAAPGVNIASTYPHNQYAALSGTSMASPHVTALAALIRSVNPLLKNTEVMEIMRKSATDLGAQGKDKYFGYGQIDVTKALELAKQNQQSLSMVSEWIDRELLRIAEKYKK